MVSGTRLRDQRNGVAAAPSCTTWGAAYYITLHCIGLHRITLQYSTLHCIALHYIAELYDLGSGIGNVVAGAALLAAFAAGAAADAAADAAAGGGGDRTPSPFPLAAVQGGL